MKKRIVSLLILSTMISSYVVPIWGQKNTIKGENDFYDNLQPVLIDKCIKIIVESNISSYNYKFSSKLNEILHINQGLQLNSNLKTVEQKVFTYGWLNSNANIREYPDINSNIITTLPYGTQIEFSRFNDEWMKCKYFDSIYYVYVDLVSEIEIKSPDYVEYETPDNKIKSYMPYKAITSKSSNQYKLQKIAYTGNYGIRQVNGRYCIAVGSAYTTEIGTYIDLVLDNGTVIPCILGDCKDDRHTDSSNKVSSDGALAEFIVDISSLNTMVRKMGSLDYACEEWNSKITKIRIYNRKENFE